MELKMSNIVALKNKTIEKMVDQIHQEFAAANADTKRADRARLRAGRLLIELRTRVESGEVGEGVKWWKWYKENFARSKRDAQKVMKLAGATNPEAAHDQAKEKNKQEQQKLRAADVSHQSPVEHILELIEILTQEERRQLLTELRRRYAYTDQDH